MTPSVGDGRAAIVAREFLVIEPVGVSGRRPPASGVRDGVPDGPPVVTGPIHTDAIEARIVSRQWLAPKAGEQVALPDGATRTWQEAQAGADGWLEHRALRGGYAYYALDSAERRIVILNAQGHDMVYVNGVPRAGDPYATGYVTLPIQLENGLNSLLFRCGRGRLKVETCEPQAAAEIITRDTTLPDAITSEPLDAWGAVAIANASNEARDDLWIEAVVEPPGRGDDTARVLTHVPVIPPLSVRKAAFRIVAPAPSAKGERVLRLTLMAQDRALDITTVSLAIKNRDENQKRTSVSEIDGSVQYYALLPATGWGAGGPGVGGVTTQPQSLALFLTLHGAAVEAVRQTGSYTPKTWGHLVAPTNRRPYGFDWEDWGRLDALEVLELAAAQLNADPRRIYLTGHSMGGHGVWHLGVTYPDRFAAIGPSAGWISLFSYADATRDHAPTPMRQMLLRGMAPSDTIALARNLATVGAHVLHGAMDDNVPVTESDRMSRVLAAFHKDWYYRQEPGAGHWWDRRETPGVDCVDWGPMFGFFRERRAPAPETVRQIDFITASPGVSARSHWGAIEDQLRRGELSYVSMRCDPAVSPLTGLTTNGLVGFTTNVARLAVDLTPLTPGAPVMVKLDKQEVGEIPWPAGEERLWFTRSQNGSWSLAQRPSPRLKGPHRYGPFKQAFARRMVFVHGTNGTPEENDWALAKARYDAETWWVRGNGTVDVIPDTAFDASVEPDRNVILYGNAQTNRAWMRLLSDCPVNVERGRVRIGTRELAGEDLGCLFLWPRPGSDRACVGVIGGSGAVGMRLTDRAPIFASGVAYPDLLVLGAETLAVGDGGVRCAGYFGADWGVDSGEFVWRQE